MFYRPSAGSEDPFCPEVSSGFFQSFRLKQVGVFHTGIGEMLIPSSREVYLKPEELYLRVLFKEVFFIKLFSCTNKECKSHVPYDAKTNRVITRITSDHPMLEDGTVNPESEAEVVKIRYICGRCKSVVKEVPLTKVMKIKIEKVNDVYAYGVFFNKLRKKPYKFNIEKETGEVEIEGLNPLKVEVEYIKEEYKQSYIDSITAEVIDYEEDKHGIKTYEVNINNPSQRTNLTIFIKENKMEDYYGREPIKIEVSKAISKVREVPY